MVVFVGEWKTHIAKPAPRDDVTKDVTILSGSVHTINKTDML